GSLTGSFDQGVSWFSRLLTAQVYPAPDSETWKPKPGFAMTLIQGAGVHCPSPSTATYSRPSASKPPRPFQSSSSRRGGAGASGGAAAGRRARGRGPPSVRSRPTTCSEGGPL